MAFLFISISGLFASHTIAQCTNPIAAFIFFDAGEGDSILIKSQDKSVLIDTGNLISGHRILQSLRALGITHLDRIILTHPHPDHIGGVFQIAQSISFTSIHDNGENLRIEPSDIFRWYSDLVRNNPRYSILSQGDQFNIGAVKLNVLSPSANSMTSDWNTNSLVLSVHIGSSRILLMGDANLETEAALIRHGVDLKADILKVGHHGANDATSEAFIKRVRPTHTIISSNKNNIRGYPSSSVINRLKKYSSLYQTKDLGAVTFTLCNDGTYEVITER